MNSTWCELLWITELGLVVGLTLMVGLGLSGARVDWGGGIG